MKHERQIEIIDRVLRFNTEHTTQMAAEIAYNATSTYTDEAQLAKEQETFFRNGPLIVGFSCQVPSPGDFLTNRDTGVPILVARGHEGEINAFMNVCRHRGSLIAGEPCGHVKKNFVCPYHAWSYDLQGALVAIPENYGFDSLDQAELGLVRLPVAEKYGLIWVLPSAGAKLNIDSYLGGLAEDLASYDISNWALHDRRVLHPNMNWKLVSDTFWEIYHIASLHKATIAPLFQPNLAALDTFGFHHRVCGIKKSLLGLRDVPPSEWSLYPHATILYSIFPNTVYIMQGDHVEIFQIFPHRGRGDESVITINLLTPEPAISEKAKRHWDANMQLLLDVLDEDFVVGEGIQRGFGSRAQERVTYGRFEAALNHFHSSIRQALGIPS